MEEPKPKPADEPVADQYENEVCPDCGRAIPADAVSGSECSCGHVFWHMGQTEGN
jgi:hypothetical protein